MATEDLIEATAFCTYHEIDQSFIASLNSAGFVTFMEINNQQYITHSQLHQLEKIIRLHRELEINLSGIEAIVNMLERVEEIQQENRSLKNKLRFYEDL